MRKFIPITMLMALLPVLVFAYSSELHTITTTHDFLSIVVSPKDDEFIPPPNFVTSDNDSVSDGDPSGSVITGQVRGEEPETTAVDPVYKFDGVAGEGLDGDDAGSDDGLELRLDDDSDGDGIEEKDALELDDDREEPEDEAHSDWIDVSSLRWGTTQGSFVIDDTSSFADIDIDDNGYVTISGKEISKDDRENVRRLFDDNDEKEENVDGRPIEDIALNFGKIDTTEELTEYAGLLAVADENIKQIELQSDAVALEYKYPAKLFWLIPVNYTARVEVDNEGVVKVKFPWWMFLAKDNAKDIRNGIKDEIQSLGDSAFLANGLQNALQNQQRMLQVLSSASKSLHDTAMAVIRNIR